jgi:Glycosyltransferase family 87
MPLVGGGTALLLLSAFYLWTIDFRSRQAYSTDFAQFHASAQNLAAGGDIYAPVPWDRYGPLPGNFESDREYKHPNLNPPFQSLLLLPLGFFSFATAFRVWTLLSLLFGACGALIVARQIDAAEFRRSGGLALMVMLFLYFPSWLDIALGQFGHLLFLLAAVAWTAARSGRDAVAGLALGLSLAIKPFTGLFLILFLLLRRWRLLSWYLATFVACGAFGLTAAGFDAHIRYLRLLSDVDWYAATWNASILGFASRIFGGAGNEALIDVPMAATSIHMVAAVLGLSVLVWLARRHRIAPDGARFDLAFAAVLPLMLLLSPLGWLYYFPYLLIPLAVVVLHSNSLARRWAYLAPAAVAWLLSTLPHLQTRSEKVADPALIFTYPTFYSLSLLILVATLVALAVALEPQPAPEQGADAAP